MASDYPKCPECETELTDDFGIVDCKSCGTVCSVDLDGAVQVQGVVDAEPEEDLSLVEEAETDEAIDYHQELEVGVVDDADGVEEAEESVEEELPVIDEPLDYYQEQGVVEAADEEDLFDEAEQAVESTALAPMLGVDFLKGLEVFAEESTEGSYHIYYDLHIAGVDSQEEKDLVVEYLADQRLELSEDYVRELVKTGANFIVPQLSFLRLSVAYKRLLPLNLEVSWTLSDVQQPHAEEDSTLEEGSPEGGEYSSDEDYLDDDLV